MLPSKGIAWVADFVQRQLHQRIDEIGPKNFASAPENDFLDTILRMHGQDPDKIRLQDCFRYSMTNIGAGSDTTSVSLASIMYHVITSPHCLQKVGIQSCVETCTVRLIDPRFDKSLMKQRSVGNFPSWSHFPSHSNCLFCKRALKKGYGCIPQRAFH